MSFVEVSSFFCIYLDQISPTRAVCSGYCALKPQKNERKGRLSWNKRYRYEIGDSLMQHARTLLCEHILHAKHAIFDQNKYLISFIKVLFFFWVFTVINFNFTLTFQCITHDPDIISFMAIKDNLAYVLLDKLLVIQFFFLHD